ncbi:MAG: tRNA (guanosine(46)-N7)-methyltransferase TrmB [Bacillota bacterium]|nr:tRNA (guanosine(46)-N7)-methyltransferase TrmB [Bacillota bacterium]
MRARKKKWTSPFVGEHPELVLPHIDQNLPFFEYPRLYLEIGIGKGDFILGMSKKQDGHYLGIEKVVDVLAVAAKKLLDSESANVLLRLGDFDEVYEEIAGLRFDAIYLNFSDPWPKKKHGKRRLTEHNRLEKMAKILKDDGSIIIKTDNSGLYEFSKEEVPLTSLRIVYDNPDYPGDRENDEQSEYERNFRSQGVAIKRLILKKGGN